MKEKKERVGKKEIKHGDGFTRDYSKYNYNSDRRHYTPSWEEYKTKLNENVDDSRFYYIMRLGHELGLSPIAAANLKKVFFCSMKPKSIFVERAKAVLRGSKLVMRSRLLPVNDSLYIGLKDYIKTHDSDYLIPKVGFGALTMQAINYLYKQNKVKWTPHRARIFFKTQMKAVLIPKGMYDEGEVRKIMGHQPRDSGERYDDLNFDLAMMYVNEVFARRM